MLNLIKSKLLLMVILALAGFLTYNSLRSHSGQFAKAIVGSETNNPLLDYDIVTVRHWFNADCFANLYGEEQGKGVLGRICVNGVIQNVKHDTNLDITKEQIMDSKVRNILVQRAEGTVK